MALGVPRLVMRALQKCSRLQPKRKDSPPLQGCISIGRLVSFFKARPLQSCRQTAGLWALASSLHVHCTALLEAEATTVHPGLDRGPALACHAIKVPEDRGGCELRTRLRVANSNSGRGGRPWWFTGALSRQRSPGETRLSSRNHLPPPVIMNCSAGLFPKSEIRNST